MSNPSSRTAMERLRQATTPTFKLTMSANTTFVGVGTTGTLVLLKLFQHVLAATGGALPQIVKWISIDADKDSRNPDSLAEITKIRFLSIGKNGAGTVISRGAALAARAFPSIELSITDAMSSLMSARDPRFGVNLPPSRDQTVVVLAGSSGGTSGGTADQVVSACSQASEQIGLERLDITMATVGGEIPWRDITRTVNTDGQDLILANFAESTMWRCGQMATQRSIKLDVPSHGSTHLVPAMRITANVEFDWESESTKLATSEEVEEMMAASLFHRFFTAVGVRHDSRYCDDVNCGRTGQQHPLQLGATAL